MKVLIAFFGLKKNAQLPFCACQIKTKTARALGNIFDRRGSVYGDLEGYCVLQIILQDSPNNSNSEAVWIRTFKVRTHYTLHYLSDHMGPYSFILFISSFFYMLILLCIRLAPLPTKCVWTLRTKMNLNVDVFHSFQILLYCTEKNILQMRGTFTCTIGRRYIFSNDNRWWTLRRTARVSQTLWFMKSIINFAIVSVVLRIGSNVGQNSLRFNALRILI